MQHERSQAQARKLAGDAGGGGASNGLCHDTTSFLGVGNTHCLHENIGTAVFLLGIIVVVSIFFDRLIHFARHSIHCPQLSKIVDRIFQEVMIMGFISMVIFTLNTSGVMKEMNFAVDALTPTEQLHFYEFFHYIVFLTMIYFIVIVLLLLFIGTVVPKLIWKAQDPEELEDAYEDNLAAAFGAHNNDDNDDNDDGLYFDRTIDGSEDHVTRGDLNSGSHRHPARASTLRRAKSGMDLVQGSRAYSLLLERYEREGWCFKFNLQKQWHLWKSFEILAYNICQNRSGYIYKNPDEMERLFGVKSPPRSQNLLRAEPEQVPMTYVRYHVLCMRNLLYHITDLHFSALVILVVISVLPSLYPAYDHWIFIGVGGVLLFANLIIFLKVLKILRGIVDDRLRVITMRDIKTRLANIQSANEDSYDGALTPAQQQQEAAESFITMPPKRLTLKTVALGVRAVIRMQMSALCHRQLHYHDDRFWFESPKLLLRMFQFATISQAFYLVWLSLVAAPTIVEKDEAVFLLPLMVLLPFISLCIITPMTMPSLVLVMSLTGIFVDLNSEPSRAGKKVTYEVAKTRIRLMRRSFLKSHYTDNDDMTRYPGSPAIQERHTNTDTISSPTNVFLRVYDSPKAAAVHIRLGTEITSPTNSATRSVAEQRDDSATNLLSKESSGSSSLGRSRGREENGYSGPRRSFNLAAFQASATPSILSSVYHSPWKHLESNNNNSANWSQAQFDIGSSEAPRTGNDSNNSSNNSIPVDPSPSPAAESFKSYCSKYGGYPEA